MSKALAALTNSNRFLSFSEASQVAQEKAAGQGSARCPMPYWIVLVDHNGTAKVCDGWPTLQSARSIQRQKVDTARVCNSTTMGVAIIDSTGLIGWLTV